jgi:hypothetical protein
MSAGEIASITPTGRPRSTDSRSRRGDAGGEPAWERRKTVRKASDATIETRSDRVEAALLRWLEAPHANVPLVAGMIRALEFILEVEKGAIPLLEVDERPALLVDVVVLVLIDVVALSLFGRRDRPVRLAALTSLSALLSALFATEAASCERLLVEMRSNLRVDQLDHLII